MSASEAVLVPCGVFHTSARCFSWPQVFVFSFQLVECGTNLAAKPCFTYVATNLAGQPKVTSYIHANTTGAGPRFYRVGVSSQ